MSEAFLTIFMNTWGPHDLSHNHLFSSSCLCAFLLLFIWFCFCFPGIHLKPGINTFFVFPKGISSHKSISEQCRIYFRVFRGALKSPIKQPFLWCCCSEVLFLPPFPQHIYIFLIPLSFFASYAQLLTHWDFTIIQSIFASFLK